MTGMEISVRPKRRYFIEREDRPNQARCNDARYQTNWKPSPKYRSAASVYFNIGISVDRSTDNRKLKLARISRFIHHVNRNQNYVKANHYYVNTKLASYNIIVIYIKTNNYYVKDNVVYVK
jgi:hypothetical protein